MNKPPSTSWLSPLKRGNFSSLHQGMMSAGQVGLFLLFIFFFSKKINAQTFDSSSYHIDFGNFNMTSGRKTSANYTLTDTVGQNAPGQYDNTGYILKAGFQYLYEQNIPFSFKISNLDLNFGVLVPNIGSTVTNTITISTPTGHGYEVLAIANHPLRTLGGNTTIPDTKCDSGTCSETNSGLWSNVNTFGFGFNAIGVNSSMVATNIGTSNYFTNASYFRQFADSSASENAQIIMSESGPVEEHIAKVTYKVNISSTQGAGVYQNGINFIAIPKY